MTLDPTASMREQKAIAIKILAADVEDATQDPADAIALASAVIDLHDHIINGGALPAPWRGRRARGLDLAAVLSRVAEDDED